MQHAADSFIEPQIDQLKGDSGSEINSSDNVISIYFSFFLSFLIDFWLGLVVQIGWFHIKYKI
jgi:hypothetical protein